jgi:hypothetical protein
MDEFELNFVTDPIDDDLEDALLERGYSIERHGLLTQVLTVGQGSDPLEVAVGEANTLKALGVRVRRLALDLVNMVGIADHASVTKQAVQRWVAQPTFPAPYASQGSPLWAWRDVFDWLVENKPRRRTPTTPAAPLDAARFDLIWESESIDASSGHAAAPTETHAVGQWNVRKSGEMAVHAMHVIFDRPNIGVVSGRWDPVRPEAMFVEDVEELTDAR